MHLNNRPLICVLYLGAMLLLTAAQSGNSSAWHEFTIFFPTETDSNNSTNPKRLSWQDASADCIQHGRSLAHVNHFELILRSPIWTVNQPIWLGLSWINGRLQWITYIPMEEINMTAIQYYAEKRMDITRSCYSMDRNKVISVISCNKQLPYVCVMPLRDELVEEVEEESKKSSFNEKPSVEGTNPEIIPSGSFWTHSPFLVVEPSANVNFELSCAVSNTDEQLQYRWLRNGAYKSRFDGNETVSDSHFELGFGDALIAAKTRWWIRNWTGKIACEIVYTSTGQVYRSKEVILVLPQSVSLRVEFQFKTVNFSAMQNYFEIFMQRQLRNHTGIPFHLLPDFQFDFPPFLSYPEKSTTTFSFYVHWPNLDQDGTKKLSLFLRNISAVDSFNYWMSLKDGASIEYDRYFQNIRVVMLNYCLDGATDPTLVFANQPTLAKPPNFHFHVKDIDECEYATRQCTADWFNPAWFRSWSVPLTCMNCMASFHDYKERCVKIIKPLPFSRSIAQCMAGYWNDTIGGFDISEWILFALRWIDENMQSDVAVNLDLNQLWLPVQRRTHLGPLRPVWPWRPHWQNLTATEVRWEINLSSWGEELQDIVERSGLLADWSKLNASLNCLKLDTKRRMLESASCTENIPMICTRPRLKTLRRSVGVNAQCPLGWTTSTLIAERNYCYKIVYDDQNVTFDEAEGECQKLGGHLALATEPSTLAIILNIFSWHLFFGENTDYPGKVRIFLWIGLKKNPDGFKWIDRSNWTYSHQVQWDVTTYRGKPVNEDTTYGVSISNSPDNDVQRKLGVIWNTWVKEAGLNRFICQREIFPEQRLSLQMHLDFRYVPVVTVWRIPLHIRKTDDDTGIFSSSLLKEIQPHEEPEAERLSLSRLTCFMENLTFAMDYHTSDPVTVNYHVISRPGEYAGTRNVSLMKWRATETTCETWNESWNQNLKASWVMSSATDEFYSYIVTLKHRTEKYLSEKHDATFPASSNYRAAYEQRHLHDIVVRQFLCSGQWVSATDPVAFEAETYSQSLLIKYRIVMKLTHPLAEFSARKRREPFEIKSREPMPGSMEEDCLEDIRLYFSDKFNESRNDDRQTFGERLDFVNVRSTEFCPSEFTSVDGKFMGSPWLRWWSLVSPHSALMPFSSTSTMESTNSSVILSWPMSPVGSRVTPTPYCVKQDGHMLYRRCLGNQFTGAYWEPLENDQSGCVKNLPLFDQLNSISTWMLEELGTIGTLQTIRQSISNWSPNPAELELLINSLFLISTHNSDELNSEDIKNFNIILHQINSLETETLIRAQQSPTFSSHLSRATERFFARTSMSTNQDGQQNVNQRFDLELPFVAATSWERSYEFNNDSVIGFTIAANKTSIVQSHVLLQSATFDQIEQFNVTVLLPFQGNIHDREQVTFIACPDSRLMDASAASGRFLSAVFTSDLSHANRWTQSDHLFTGNGGMVQVVLSPAPPKLLKPLTLFFRPRIPTTAENGHLLRCVFWDEKINSGNGGWSIDGCWLEGSRSGLEVCHCNHLSTFTLLVSRSEKELQSTVHGTILNFITVVGCLASIVGLVLILATFVTFPSWRKPLGHKLLAQLSVALIILLVTFITGVDHVSNSQVCRVVAILLHYFLLAAFCWMTIEAYNQYQRLVKVFGTYMPRFLLKATVLAWTAPSLPVIAVLIYDVDAYSGSQGYCWISPAVFYLAVLGPVAILFLINLSLFLLVIRSIATSGRGLRTNQPKSKQAKEKFIASFMNFVLLGMSWVLGFFAIGPTNSVIFSYLFCFSTTLQGFFLFVLSVGRDRLARHLWLERLGLGKSGSNGQPNKSKATSTAGVHSSQVESYSTTSAAATESFVYDSSIARELKRTDFGKRLRESQPKASTRV